MPIAEFIFCSESVQIESTVIMYSAIGPYIGIVMLAAGHRCASPRKKWGHHTTQYFFEMADALALCKDSLTKTKFEFLQQCLGLNYQPHGLNWELYLRRHFCAVENQYEDWLHTLYASKGLATYEVSSFVHALKDLSKPCSTPLLQNVEP